MLLFGLELLKERWVMLVLVGLDKLGILLVCKWVCSKFLLVKLVLKFKWILLERVVFFFIGVGVVVLKLLMLFCCC